MEGKHKDPDFLNFPESKKFNVRMIILNYLTPLFFSILVLLEIPYFENKRYAYPLTVFRTVIYNMYTIKGLLSISREYS